MNEVIAIAQQILDAYNVTHDELSSNFWYPYGSTPMKLENLQRREGFALATISFSRFKGEVDDKDIQICKKFMKIIEWFEE